MNKIVIVEDRLNRGISLAEQFVAFSNEHPEFEIDVSDICYFCPNQKKAETEIQGVDNNDFNIKRVALENFRETMDVYLNDSDNPTLLIMDYLLEGDGSDGTPIKRVNIRYARNSNRLDTNKLFFYTATGANNELVLSELVGSDHILQVQDVSDDSLKLDLDNNKFREALCHDENVGV